MGTTSSSSNHTEIATKKRTQIKNLIKFCKHHKILIEFNSLLIYGYIRNNCNTLNISLLPISIADLIENTFYLHQIATFNPNTNIYSYKRLPSIPYQFKIKRDHHDTLPQTNINYPPSTVFDIFGNPINTNKVKKDHKYIAKQNDFTYNNIKKFRDKLLKMDINNYSDNKIMELINNKEFIKNIEILWQQHGFVSTWKQKVGYFIFFNKGNDKKINNYFECNQCFFGVSTMFFEFNCVGCEKLSSFSTSSISFDENGNYNQEMMCSHCSWNYYFMCPPHEQKERRKNQFKPKYSYLIQ